MSGPIVVVAQQLCVAFKESKDFKQCSLTHVLIVRNLTLHNLTEQANFSVGNTLTDTIDGASKRQGRLVIGEWRRLRAMGKQG